MSLPDGAAPPHKRRRISTTTTGSQTLTKPFRSPFKTTPLKPTNTSTSSYSPTTTHINNLPNSQQKTHLLSINRSIANLRADIDTAQQALKIETSNRDAELERLIDKWRSVSREAAEMLYADVRERVNRMGGPRVWREMERTRERRSRGGWWAEENEEEGLKGPDGDGDGDGDRARLERERYDFDDGGETDQDPKVEDGTREEEEDVSSSPCLCTFTSPPLGSFFLYGCQRTRTRTREGREFYPSYQHTDRNVWDGVGIHDRYDAQDTECGFERYRVR